MVTKTLAIAVRDVVKEFRMPGAEPLRAVDGLNLTVPAGEIVALLGPNGAGKTTTVDMLLGLTEPTSGTVEVAGTTPRHAVQAGKVAAVLQSGGLLADLTVAETVRLIASTFPQARPPHQVMEQVGITDLARRRVSKCSGGEQQRLRFALALLPDPEVLLLDEPTAGMDVAARHAFWDTMRADADRGRTVVFATHYLEEADAFAERIVVMNHGRVIADGTPAHIRARGAGRVISLDLPDDETTHAAWLATIEKLPGVRHIQVRAGRVVIAAADTDATALTLLRDVGASNIEIAPTTLDSAFVALTGQDNSADRDVHTDGAVA